MVLAMLGFAIEDMFVKKLTVGLPVGQVLILFGLGGMLVFALIVSFWLSLAFLLLSVLVWLFGGQVAARDKRRPQSSGGPGGRAAGAADHAVLP